MPDLASVIQAAAERYGVPSDYLLRSAQIESNMDPMAANPGSTAKGLFQFVDRTRQQYGNFDPFSPEASADAAARLARDNAGVLRNGLGRDPTSGELYLAHQQGAGGALKLLLNPDTAAETLVGPEAVAKNGGRAGMTGRDFAGLWTSKFGQGAAPAAATPGITIPDAPRGRGDDLGGLMMAMPDQAKPKAAKKAAPQARNVDIGALFNDLSPNLVLSRTS